MDESTSPEEPTSDISHKSGLPPISPDFVEQEEGDVFDNLVPTVTYNRLPVVGLGGSAGSFPALQGFFTALPPDTGMAFVVVIHLSSEHESILDEIVGRYTSMPVLQPVHGQKLEPNHVYVIPPGQFLAATNGCISLTPIEPERGKRVAVDLFFRTLADSHGPQATAIVLSGADGDGALGIKRMKERGGLTIAQDPEEAEHPGMPCSAINTEMVDWVMPVAAMPARILEYRRHGARLRLPPEEAPKSVKLHGGVAEADEHSLRDILGHLRLRTGHDFSCYKRATVLRRISRRMQVNGTATLPEYLNFVRTHPGESGALHQDLLISVTNFFRDREAFEVLEQQIPSLFAGKKAGQSVRVWCAGCATGEEAYSVAMLVLEYADRLDSPPSIQIFATDLAEDVIGAARDGFFPFTIQADVSEERLRRFFIREHRGFRARRDLRECILFAAHDLLKDPPFSRMDLFTCRNLLIYLTPEAQKRAIDTAHFALLPGGLMFLGSSESVDEENLNWTALDKKHRLYRQRPLLKPELPIPLRTYLPPRLAEPRQTAYVHGPAFHQQARLNAEHDFQEKVKATVSWEELHFKLIERLAPPSLIITRDYDIVHVSENAGRFLHFGGGEPSTNLMKAVQPMLRVELRAALFRATQTGKPVEAFRVPLELEGESMLVDIRITPAQDLAPDYLLVVFAVREERDSEAVQAREEVEPTVRHLERELEQMRMRLRDTVEQFEASMEEQKASSEELQAMNEELRSSTEELETSREELQSVNEELTTLNQELKSKLDDLGSTNADLSNLMAASGVATIFLDRNLIITRYTPSAVTLFRLIPTDLGRPLTDLTHRLNYPELKEDSEAVLETLTRLKREVTDGTHWFVAHLLPYRSSEDRIAGVVLTFVDVTESRKVSRALTDSEHKLRTLADAVPQIIWANNAEGEANYFNSRWYEYTGLSFEESAGPGWQAIVHPEDEIASRQRWEIAQAEGVVFDTEYRLRNKGGEYRWFIGRNVPMLDGEGKVKGWFGTATDIQDLKDATSALRSSEEQFRRALEDAPIPVMMHAEDGQMLQLSKVWTELTGYTTEDIPTFEKWLELGYGPAAEEMRTQMQRLFQGNTRTGGSEVLVITRNGEQRCWTFSASAPGTLRDERRFIVTMALDITDRTAAESALRESQERLRLIVENAREYAIFSMDLTRQIKSWNRGAEAILQYTEQEAVGRTGDMIFTPEDLAKGAHLMEAQTAIAEGRAADERWHVRKDGSHFWGSGVMMAMHDGQGNAIGLVKIFRDHTEQLRAQQALEQSSKELWQALQATNQARAEAEAAGRAKDHFLAVLSHELRTPLTPVMMAVQTLTRRKDLPDAVREALEMIRRNILLEARFVDELLDITKIERGLMELTLAPMDLHEAIGHAVEISRPDIEAREQVLTVDLSAARHEMQGDRSRLQQAVWNLLKNASKFTPVRGAITLRTRNEGERVLIEITDSGIGIDKEALSRIFDPFVQADAEITRQYGGLGLGLAIARASVLGHQGQLRVRSEGLGHGATFLMELPTGN